MRIAIVSDAWAPQVNGVVRALEATVAELRRAGHDPMVISPGRFVTIPCPSYPEIRLAIGAGKRVRRILDLFSPDAIHIATEGPLGWAARGWCLKRGRAFTTSFHTRFPDYVAVRTGIPARWTWGLMRRFHGAAARTFAVTGTLAEELVGRGIGSVHRWPLGVDLTAFGKGARPHPALAYLPRPILLSVGRVAVEKNLEAFLKCEVAGTKVVVGDGPALAGLKRAFPRAIFMGALSGEALASAYAAADVFVFPSRTDTFGLVNIEALASGVPVAGYPVAGPLDIVGVDGCGMHGGRVPIGALDEDLGAAIARALRADRAGCRAEAAHYGWAQCTRSFVAGLARRSAPVVALSEIKARQVAAAPV